jgi:transcriptional regulator with XRE-family HTH domain
MLENPETIKEIIARNIRKYRAGANLSQEKLAEICLLHRTYIGSVERCERNITVNTLCTLANALNVTVIELLTDHENR